MARKNKGLVVAAIAFANTPQGKALIQQAKVYLSRPETRQKGLQLLEQVRTQAKTRIAARSAARTSAPPSSYRTVRGTTKPDS